MSVESFFSSGSKIQVLRVLSESSSALSPQELEEETTKNISVIYDTLRELEEEKIIVAVKADGRKNYYRLNRSSKLAGSAREMFKIEREEYSLEDVPAHLLNIIFDARKKLKKKVEDLQMVILFGSVPRGDFTPESDIDLYIVIEEAGKEKEDQIYDILEPYERDFSAVIRDVEGYRSDFSNGMSDLGKSILVEGYSILFTSEDTENLLEDKISSEADDWTIKPLGEHARDELNMKSLKDHVVEELKKELDEE